VSTEYGTERCKETLRAYLDGIDIIDTHEHLCTEAHHLTEDYNFFHLLIPYVMFDLHGAGMPCEWLWHPPKSPAQTDEYWKVIGPLWRYVRHGAYARLHNGPEGVFGV
jgi:hypothetical protein